MLEIHATALSANGRKVLALRHHLGIEARVHEVNVYRGEGQTPTYLRIHPLGKIPTLVDGPAVLTESNAILLYLSEVCGGFRCGSRDPRERAQIAAWLFWESAHRQPVLSQVLAPHVAWTLRIPGASAPTALPDWTTPELSRQLGYLESSLEGRTFLHGDALTLADFSVAGMCTYLGATGFPFHTWPSLRAWYERVEALDAWQATAADLWARAPA